MGADQFDGRRQLSPGPLIVQSLITGAKDVQTFESNPLFKARPQVTSGHIAETQSFTDDGPIGVPFEYS